MRHQSDYRQKTAQNLGLTDKIDKKVKRILEKERKTAEWKNIRAEQGQAQKELLQHEKCKLYQKK